MPLMPLSNPDYQFLMKSARTLTKNDILNTKSIKDNPLAILIIKKYINSEVFDGENLVKDILEFCTATSQDDKLKFVFRVYDSDGDGLISNMELFEMLKVLNKGILDDWKIQNIVDKTFAETGEYKTTMDYNDFKEIITKRSANILDIFNYKSTLSK